MDTPIATIEIDETHRYAQYLDYSYGDVSEVVGDWLGVQGVTSYGTLAGSAYDEWRDVWQTYVQRFRDRYNGNDLALRAFHLHLTASGVPNRMTTLRGYSQGDWADVVVYLHDEESLAGRDDKTRLDIAERDAEEWFRGDVWVIACETLVTYRADNGATIERWERQDATGWYMGAFTRQMCDEQFGYLFTAPDEDTPSVIQV